MQTFLALGDSYTIGEAVQDSERWPVQLVQQLREAGIKIADPHIIATTGWTTDELLAAIDQQRWQLRENYSLVSLLIGVNNQYRSYPLETYRKEFTVLLDQAIAFAAGEGAKVIVLSIPDYGVTPFAADKNPEKIARELDDYNNLAREVAEKKGARWINITPASRDARYDPELLAHDSLHPSASMYKEWVGQIFPYVVNLLRNQ